MPVPSDGVAQRLRDEHRFRFGSDEDGGEAPSLFTEAADLIEAQHAENGRLRELLAEAAPLIRGGLNWRINAALSGSEEWSVPEDFVMVQKSVVGGLTANVKRWRGRASAERLKRQRWRKRALAAEAEVKRLRQELGSAGKDNADA